LLSSPRAACFGYTTSTIQDSKKSRECHHTDQKVKRLYNPGVYPEKSPEPANTPSSRFQPEESRSKFQDSVLRQPDRVVRQPEESSSIEASTYRKPSSYNTHAIHLDQHSQEGGINCCNAKEKGSALVYSKQSAEQQAVVKTGATGDTSVL
jgi:hypothetical protein